ncbi:MAG: hypothetical protein MK085_07135 [Phycisphaerales bacterium]|nr:hypothetical protein [Phycisphaerales bacterium]
MSHAPAFKADLSESNIRLGSETLNVQSGALIVGIVGLLASAVIGFTGMFGVTPDYFAKSWIQNYIFVLSIALGAFFFVFIQHLTRAGWSATVRRPAEVIAANLQWAWLGFVPILALWIAGSFGHHEAGADGHGAAWGPGMLFPWADLEAMKAHNPAEYDLVSNKSAYLNSGFFWVRAVLYFLFWGLASRWYFRTSLEQDRTGDVGLTRQMQKWAGPTTLLFGLTISFAAIDWIMSLSPAWFSTMFGVYFFTGCVTCGFAAIIVVLIRLQEAGRLQGLVSREHYQDLGKLLFAFGMVFWAYIGFSQYMLIWYANIPEETGWFLARQIGGWAPVSLVLLFGHFCIPFVALISKWPKRIRWSLIAAAMWMLAFGWLDTFWLVMPVVPEDAYVAETYMDVVEAHANDSTNLFNPINFTMLAGFVGIFTWMTLRRMRSVPLVAERDPRLHEGLAFENQ